MIISKAISKNVKCLNLIVNKYCFLRNKVCFLKIVMDCLRKNTGYCLLFLLVCLHAYIVVILTFYPTLPALLTPKWGVRSAGSVGCFKHITTTTYVKKVPPQMTSFAIHLPYFVGQIGRMTQ